MQFLSHRFFTRAIFDYSLSTFKWICSFYSVVSLLSPLVIFESYSFFARLLYAVVCVLGIFALLYVATFFKTICFNNVREIAQLRNGHHLYLKFGDIFDPDVIESDKRNNIVIPFNRCFDVIVDDDLIAKSSLHGQLILKLEENGMTRDNIKCAIQQSLAHRGYCHDVSYKKVGNRNRYREGAVADIRGVKKEHYFCVGLSKFEGKTAQTSRTEYVCALDHLIYRITELSQGQPVYIPLIGTALSRTKIDNNVALSIIVNLIKLYAKDIPCDIYIVLKKGLESEIRIP